MKKDIEIKLHEKLRKKLLSLPDCAVDFIYSLETSKELKTRIEYAKDLTLFVEFLLLDSKVSSSDTRNITTAELDSLRDRDIIDFMDYLTHYSKTYLTTKGKEITQEFTNTASGKSRKLATLHKFFGYLFKQKRLSKDVTAGIEMKVPTKAKIKNRLSPEDIERFFQTILEDVHIENTRKESFHKKVKFRDYIMVLTMAYTGIRVSELVQLDIDDVYIDKQMLVVIRKGGDEQAIPMPGRILDDLKDYLVKRKKLTDVKKEDANALFISLHKKRMNERTVRLMLEKYRVRSGLDIKITPHVFRRTFGTNHYNTYQDMYLTAQVLGHGSAETTRRFYADPSQERVSESMKQFDYEYDKKKKTDEPIQLSKLEQLANKLGMDIDELMAELK
ncbi:tyrosine-type recombinase/integrase [Bacillus sp. NPDC094106]|uniref:tyrosine-type recombinase/integrase n=1 Tax=Bacillus sp. NPDC094106 TaxID=3363949 RepID=UPI0037FDF8CA